MKHFRCVLMGGESLLVNCAEILRARGHTIAAVITHDALIRSWAEALGIEVVAQGNDLAVRVSHLEFDYFFSIANLSVVPDAVIAQARWGGINFHDGPLPKYAGLYATSWALLHREPMHGVVWHEMRGGVDEGDILNERAFPIHEHDTALTLNTKCYELGIETFQELVEDIEEERVKKKRQALESRTYYGKYERPHAACSIDWSRSADEIVALFRALDFGAYSNPLGVPKIKIHSHVFWVRKAEKLESAMNARPGTVLAIRDATIEVATATESIALSEFLDSDGRTISVKEVIARGEVQQGAVLLPFEATYSQRLTQLNAQLARHEAYWLKRLREAQWLPVPFSTETNATSTPHERVLIPIRVPEGLREDALVAGCLVWLSRMTRTSSFDVGYADSALKDALEGYEGYFSLYRPFHVDVLPSASFDEVQKNLGAELRKTRDKQTFARDVTCRYPGLSTQEPSVCVEVLESCVTEAFPNQAAFTLQVGLHDGRCCVVIDSAKMDGFHIEKLPERLESFLTALVSHADRPIGSISMVPPEERKALLQQWTRASTSFDNDTGVHAFFERQAVRTPDAIALAFGTKTLSYQELNERANQLAHYLKSLGVGPESLVGVMSERGFDLVIAVLGVLKAGGAYVPLDPAYPKDRTALVIEDSGVKTIVSIESWASDNPQVQARWVCADRDAREISCQPTSNLDVRVKGNHLAYVMYTSGSTGRPKGVMVEHRNVANFFAGMDERIPREKVGNETWLAVTSLSFDISVLELLWTLARGFKVVIASENEKILGSSGHVSRPLEFSLFYFASDEGENTAQKKYQLLLEGAKFADANGFEAVWTPERHFHAFGGLYPNPSVASAAIASITKRVGIRAGSCVLPLHSPIRVAEEWGLVDNLSNGRVGISFASGWQPNDFVFKPENFANAKNVMLRDIDVVRKLWRGETMTFDGPKGPVEVRTLPRPVQKELPFWVTAAGNPETFAAAGKIGANILTHLLGQTIEELEGKVRAYRTAWQAAGHRGVGKVTLMLHTFVGESDAEVKAKVRGPLKDYLRSSLNLIQQHAWAFPAFKRAANAQASFEDNFQNLSPEDMEALLEHSFERYYETSGLFGTPESCQTMIKKLRSISVDEVACLIDFGIESDTVLRHLHALNETRKLAQPETTTAYEDTSIPAQIRRHEVTHLQCTPSMARMLLTHYEARDALRNVKHLFFGGEALPISLAQEALSVGEVSLTNMYGPTETTIWSSTARIDRSDSWITLGTPIANTSFYVLDEERELVPIGVPGELYIGGDGVARGYFHRNDLTNERFIKNPFSSSSDSRMYRTGDLVRYLPDRGIEFLGRVDHQVKVRGYRIELGEIESVLLALPEVRDAVVVAREDTPSDQRLVAYLISRGSVLRTEEIQQYVHRKLPEFMVPSFFVQLDQFPMTPNGKVDRKALPAPVRHQAQKTAYVAPENHVEEVVAQVWQRVLGVAQVGAQDNFFALGGHSLLAVQAHREIREALEKELTVTDIFRFPTLRALSHFLAQGDGGESLSQGMSRGENRREALRRRSDLRKKRAGETHGEAE